MSDKGVDKSLYLQKPVPPQRMSGGRFIAETFKGYGVTHVFFVEAIARLALVEMEVLGIERILAHSEKAAAYMADGYARVSRRPGICMAQSVGAANLASGLQDPYLGLSPVIAITGFKPDVAQYRNAYQEILHNIMFDPVTKFNAQVSTLAQLPYLLRQAFREATSGKPRPVHLDLAGYSGNIIATSEMEMEVLIEGAFKSFPSNRPCPDEEKVKAAAEFIQQASRPIFVAGGGAKASDAGPEIVKLAEMLSIPVATSLSGKGVMLENHPLCVGVVGSYSRWCANRLVSEADLVIYIGSQTGDQVTNAWKIPKLGTKVIQIDIDSTELGRSYPNIVGLTGDAKASLQSLLKHVNPKDKKSEWAQHAKEVVAEWCKEYEPLCTSATKPIRPERLCREVATSLPSDAILVADTGYSGIWTGALIPITHPNQTYLRAAGSLGWAFPASLGAKCAAPERPVVCFTGDGGFWYHLAELETAVRCGINTVTVINNNFGLGQCVPHVNAAYANRKGNKDALCRFRQTSFATLAQDMGCLGIRVEDPADIADALKTALEANVPAVVEVVTDIGYEAPEPWAP
ncbi:MAG: thiamine pyrophosphate-binding protein [Deltaproteobacteria bacterium]